MTLKISPDLDLPIDAVTQTFAVLAVRGAGKSNTGVVMAEEMYKAGLPFVVFDPKGDWWGLRSSGDGKKPGLDVPIFGAAGRKRKNKPEPDLPLEPTAGALIADLVVEERVPCILDVSGFSEGDKIKFLTAFGTQLFSRNEEPLHLFLEECDDYLPQKPFKEQTRLLHIYTKILKQGRTFGLGATLISQRSAVVNKNALTQCATLIAMRTTSPQDRRAIRDWVEAKGAETELVESLPTLGDGEAWVWSPEFLKTTKRVQFRRRKTFDSGATPKVGESRPIATLADIDLGTLEKSMSETIERAKADDPKELRRRIAQLEKEIRERPTEVAEPVEIEVPVEVPVMPKEDRDHIWAVLKDLGNQFDRIEETLRVTSTRIPVPKKSLPVSRPQVREEKRNPLRQTAPKPVPTAGDTGQPELSDYGFGLLQALARQHPMRPTRTQLAMFAGRKHKSSAYSAAMVEIKRGGYVEESGKQFSLTDAGWAVVGDAPRAPVSPEEGRDFWLSSLPTYESELLAAIFRMYPDGLTRDELSEETGRSKTSSAFSSAIQTLKRNDLVRDAGGELVAQDWLFS